MTNATAPLSDFLADRITPDAESGCWIWTGNKYGNGYGRLSGKRRAQAGTAMSHRAVYEQHRGPIPTGLVMGHLCRNHICCNPDHLEPVTQMENLVRGVNPKIRVAQTGTCSKGHAIEGDNLYVSPDGQRRCRECLRDERAARYQRVKGERGISDRSKRGACAEIECDALHYALGLCKKHWQQASRKKQQSRTGA